MCSVQRLKLRVPSIDPFFRTGKVRPALLINWHLPQLRITFAKVCEAK